MIHSCEQDRAARLFQQGHNVSAEAVPGAGKTWMLIRACLLAPKPCLVLAYNVQLATSIRRALAEADLSADVTCCTFHSLCSRTLVSARDDVDILHAVQAVRDGKLEPHSIPEARRVLIDEAQDVRELYVELLHILRLCHPYVPTMVAGDRMQLVYDFDPQFPSTLDTLLSPETAFFEGGDAGWEKVHMTVSHRLTQPIARFVSAVFGTEITSSREDEGAVEVRSANFFKLFSALEDVLLADDAPKHVMLLVHRKKNNRPLCLLLNQLSHRGVPVHLHGVDTDEHECAHGKLCCSTWWAAKGMEMYTVICLVPQFTPRNPLYVALTRALHKLIIVLDERTPHAAIMRALHQVPASSVRLDERTRHLLDKYAPGRNSEDSFEPRRFESSSSHGALMRTRDMDGWRAPRDIESCFSVRAVSSSTVHEDSSTASVIKVDDERVEDVSKVAACMAVSYCELMATGRIRAMDAVINPVRIDPGLHLAAIRLGLANRWVSTNRPAGEALLADDLHAMSERAYTSLQAEARRRSLSSQEDLATVSLAIMAWDSYDHGMRQLLPVRTWCHHSAVVRAMELARATLPTTLTGVHADYDVVLRKEVKGATLTVRAEAVDRHACYMTVWDEDCDSPSHDALKRAALRAALHSTGTCVLVDLATGWVKHVTTHDDGLWGFVRDE